MHATVIEYIEVQLQDILVVVSTVATKGTTLTYTEGSLMACRKSKGVFGNET